LGKKIASDMADHFYAYMGGDAEMNAILNAKERQFYCIQQHA
jgi:hypothetical protein